MHYLCKVTIWNRKSFTYLISPKVLSLASLSLINWSFFFHSQYGQGQLELWPCIPMSILISLKSEATQSSIWISPRFKWSNTILTFSGVSGIFSQTDNIYVVRTEVWRNRPFICLGFLGAPGFTVSSIKFAQNLKWSPPPSIEYNSRNFADLSMPLFSLTNSLYALTSLQNTRFRFSFT